MWYFRKCECYIVLHNVIFSLKKEGNAAICDNRDEPGGPCAERNKPTQETNTARFQLYVVFTYTYGS